MVLQSLPILQNRIQQHFRNSKMWLCYFTAHAYVTSLFLKYVFKNFQTNILVTLLTLYQYNRFKLPLALTDDTGSIEAIAFSSIAEDLVERNAYQASQNMKIHATDHAASLQTAVGKIRLFHIGMSTDMSSNFSIKYVIRKSFPIDKPPSTSLLSHNEVSQLFWMYHVIFITISYGKHVFSEYTCIAYITSSSN